jgi:hypothetical protein
MVKEKNAKQKKDDAYPISLNRDMFSISNVDLPHGKLT